MSESKYRFPKKFLWGVATSAHQVEGGNHNQWSVWELDHAKALATSAEYHYDDLDKWPQLKRLAKTPANYVSSKAVDHFNRYESDFKLATDLGVDSFRFSIEWSRIEPEEGAWDVEAITHYRQYLKAVKQAGMQPIVTLFHFTLPTWFAEKGGFEKRVNIQYFLRFVEKILAEYGPDLKYIITINEPVVYASNSYLQGIWPPSLSSKTKMWRVLNNLIKAHNRAAKLIRNTSRKYQVSMAHNVSYVYAGDDARLSEWSAAVADYATNHYVLKRTIKTSTFIGLNYYFSSRIYGYRQHNPDHQTSDVGWDMQPANIRYVLEDLSDRYDKPILITENGVADVDDDHRKEWLTQTVSAMNKAIGNGVSLLGYMHWSLLDNFEWEKGRWPRFGLYSVNYATMERTARPSAAVYKKIIKTMRPER